MPRNQGNVDIEKSKIDGGPSGFKHPNDGGPSAEVQKPEEFDVLGSPVEETNIRHTFPGKGHDHAAPDLPNRTVYGPDGGGMDSLRAGYTPDKGEGAGQESSDDAKLSEEGAEFPGGAKPTKVTKISSVRDRKGLDIGIHGFDDPANLSS